ncbi:Dolichyl-diphosphooligosaccharide--protein glycosyltransferase subunit WBP1 [Hysterangium stoloniferum]|nr:Dolichyl-diphosphooligosaccharide--protein glycosyltransferase subunit WBP1 [Hysterangium stoloniferum]
MRLLPLIGALLSFGAACLGRSSTGSSVLVILEPKLAKEDYSLFFDGLTERGYELTFRAPKEDSPQLFKYDEPQFSHVILFTPSAKSYAKDVTPQSLVRLLSLNTNLLVVLSTTLTQLTSLAAEFGLSPPPPGTPLVSHFPERPPPHTIVPITLPPSPLLTPNTPPILFAGTPHLMSNNPLLVPVVRAPPESFAADSETDGGADALVDAAEKGGEGLWAGSHMGVVTGFQTRSGARAMFVGGIEVFSDDYAQREVAKGVKSGNAQFVQDVAKWTLQENLVLRIDNAMHHLVGETAPREMYTTNDEVVYSVSISSFEPRKGVWVPYSGLNDLQLEFTMLDPHIRTSLPPVKGQPGVYEVTFRAPDRHGVFKFVVDYKRKGLSHLYSATVVPVVPPRHDGYPRFLSAAWPYYAGAISTSLGFLVFSAIWLGGEVEEKKRSKTE